MLRQTVILKKQCITLLILNINFVVIKIGKRGKYWSLHHFSPPLPPLSLLSLVVVEILPGCPQLLSGGADGRRWRRGASE
jgi:hypothetical protein